MALAPLLALALVGVIAWLVGSHMAATAEPAMTSRPFDSVGPPAIPRRSVPPATTAALQRTAAPPAARPSCPLAASQVLFAGPVRDSIVVDGVLVISPP
ncbi:MAG TPA: hypothetical protein VMN58_01480 [Acidimicrobiales bacterium]|nr:hypothetical protein [Acidimicrobiales bacterium]